MFGIKRKLPKRPPELDGLLSIDPAPMSKITEYNEIAMKVYNDTSLSK